MGPGGGEFKPEPLVAVLWVMNFQNSQREKNENESAAVSVI
jgi:hypothetical protein